MDYSDLYEKRHCVHKSIALPRNELSEAKKGKRSLMP